MKAKKYYGQNFLKNEKVLDDINHSFSVSENDLIIEIGPGKGALTKKILNKNVPTIVYEIDSDLIPCLKSINSDKLIIKNEDFLTSNIKKDIESFKYNDLYIVGNLPYYITTPIIKKIINSDIDPKEMIFMVQDEVADRFSAQIGSKNNGSMTMYLKYYFNVEKLFRVGKECFDPMPKVESAIIKLTKRERNFNVDENKYFKLLEDAFKLKRKTLKNNLKNYNWEEIKKILNNNNLTESVRAEEVDEKTFVEICNL